MSRETDNDFAIEQFHLGYGLFLKGKPEPECPMRLQGWREARRERRVSAVLPARPEGYYHAPAGTFD